MPELDRTTGVTTLVSSTLVSVGGEPDQLPRDSQAVDPSVDADGVVVAYALVTGPSSGRSAPRPVLRRRPRHCDRHGCRTASGGHRRSGTGRFVAFETSAGARSALDANRSPTSTSSIARRHRGARLGRPQPPRPPAASTAPSLASDASAVDITSASRSCSATTTRRLTSTSAASPAPAGPRLGARRCSWAPPRVRRSPAMGASSRRLAGLDPRGGSAAGGGAGHRPVRPRPDPEDDGPAVPGGGRADRPMVPAAPRRSRRIAGRVAFGSAAGEPGAGRTNSARDISSPSVLGVRITPASISSSDAQATAAGGAPRSPPMARSSRRCTGDDLGPGAIARPTSTCACDCERPSRPRPRSRSAARPVGSTSPPSPVTVRNAGAGPLVLGAVAPRRPRSPPRSDHGQRLRGGRPRHGAYVPHLDRVGRRPGRAWPSSS